MRIDDLPSRLIARSDSDETGCQIWRGPRDRHGYGKTSLGNKTIGAHRAAWIAANGKIPSGMCVCHSCDRPLCINPKHLFLGSVADNNADRQRKGRTAKGEHHSAHKLSDAQVVAIRNAAGTRKAVADQFGVSQALVSYIVLGKRRVSVGDTV